MKKLFFVILLSPLFSYSQTIDTLATKAYARGFGGGGGGGGGTDSADIKGYGINITRSGNVRTIIADTATLFPAVRSTVSGGGANNWTLSGSDIYSNNSGKVGVGVTSPPNKFSIYTTGTADGLSLNGTSFPAITLRSSGTIVGYAPLVVTSNGGFFDNAYAGDMGFRSESNDVLLGRFSYAILKAGVNVRVNTGTASATSSASFEVGGTNKGSIPAPVMTSTQKSAISSPAIGLTVYCSDCTATDASTGVTQTYNGSTWKNHW